MALNKAQASTSNTQFEDMDEGVSTETVAAAPAPAAAPAAPTATTALATQGSRALTAASVVSQNVLSDMKDAFRVEFDSLPVIGATQGSFFFKADDVDIGNEIKLQLISYQSTWVAAPNDTSAEVELVKYSDDGVTARDGTNLLQHINDLKAQGWSKAKIAHRVVLVGELLQTGKPSDSIGELIMVDLPDSGRKAFQTYTLQASYAVAKGRKSAEEAAVLTLKAIPDKNKNGDKYTRVAIS